MNEIKVAVYSVNFGNYRDEITNIDSIVFDKDIDYYLFTDNKSIRSAFWKIITPGLKQELDFMDAYRHSSKYFKFNIQPLLRRYDIIVWIDCKSLNQLKFKKIDLVQMVNKNKNIFFVKHPRRKTAQEELVLTVNKGKEHYANGTKFLDEIKDTTFETHLPDTHCIIYASTDENISLLQNVYDTLISKGIRRDQNIIQYVLKNNNFETKISYFKISDLNKYKVCICFFGLTRSLNHTFACIKENILTILRANCYEYDIYLHTYNLSQLSNERNFEFNCSLDRDEWKLLNPAKYQIDDQGEFDKTIDIRDYLHNGDPWPENPEVSLFNLLRQLNSLHQVNKLVNSSGNVYDCFLYLRPDLKYVENVDIKIVNNIVSNRDKKLVFTPDWQRSKGINDRFFIATESASNIIATRFNDAKDYAKHHKLHSETFLEYIIKKYNIKNKFMSQKAIRIRANGYPAPGDQSYEPELLIPPDFTFFDELNKW